MKLSRMGVAVAVLAVVIPASVSFATLQTFATFADPAKSADTPVFTLTYDENNENITSVSGQWEGQGLTLQMHNSVSYTDVTFEIGTFDTQGIFSAGPISVTNGNKLDAGALVFKDSGGAEIAVMTWAEGSITDFGLGASNRKLTVSTNVRIEDKVNPMYTYSKESFAFAFTNFVDYGDDHCATATASFTSSADIVVPEPATMCLLALGSVFCFGRRTRS